MFFLNSNSEIGLPDAVEMRKDLAVFNNYTAPGVEMHCLFGNNTGDTVDRLEHNFCTFANFISNNSINIFVSTIFDV